MKEIRSTLSFIFTTALLSFTSCFNLKTRNLQTLGKEEKKCSEYSKEDPMRHIILRHKYSTCYQSYSRDDDLFAYYVCLDRSLSECGESKKFVEEFKKSKTYSGENPAISKMVKESKNLHECQKNCVKFSYETCEPIFKKSQSSTGFSSCVAKYKGSCEKLCMMTHSTDKEFQVLKNLTDKCSAALAMTMIERCKIEQYIGKDNQIKRQNCIQTLATFSLTNCMVDFNNPKVVKKI